MTCLCIYSVSIGCIVIRGLLHVHGPVMLLEFNARFVYGHLEFKPGIIFNFCYKNTQLCTLL